MTLRKRLVITILLMIIIPAMLLMLLAASMYAAFIFGDAHTTEAVYDGSYIDEAAIVSQIQPGGRLFNYVLFFVIAALVICGASFAIGVVYLSRKILPAMKELSRSARRISSGDLDFEILGSNVAEVQEVCLAFDEMRRRLRDGVNENLRLERERNLMLAHISHDLRTPVTAIKGYAEGIMDGVAATPEMQRRYAETIEQKAVTMERMIEQMSNYSELELGRMSFDFRAVDVFDYLRGMCDDFAGDVSREGGSFEASVPDGELEVRLDREKLGRVFQNVLQNSVKYRSPDRPLEVRLSAERTPTGVHITVADNGRGVAKEDAERVFEGFYRGDPARTGGAAGHGLGLAIARQIVQKHSGRIWMTGHVGVGAEIHITLPKKEEQGEDTDN